MILLKKQLQSFLMMMTLLNIQRYRSHKKSLFKKINHPFKEVQQYQAQLPSKATLLMNNFGTAPGMWFYENNTVFVSTPGSSI